MRAGSAIVPPNKTNTCPDVLSAMSAVDLNADGSILTFNSALNGPEGGEWKDKFGEELDRLINSGTGVFIPISQVPAGKKIAYCSPQTKIKMKNGVPVKRVRLVIGGDQLIYTGPTAAQTAALEDIRLELNAAVSENAYLMTADIQDYYLGTPLPEDEKEFMRIPLKHIS
jgi:hypothetical protein